ncbi:MAG: orotidine-5'-phosphate decarboxylase [Ruminococcus sp.]|jgi:orotidine-5'-phosphate decarboxylase|nr:orotidine-5'-phosphate decarboxylase [Ruminococcus sp.]
MSFSRLISGIKKMNNPTVAGLDPKLDFIPEHIKNKSFSEYGETLAGAADALLQFNIGLIDALCDIVPAVKPQSAYYEMYGFEGVKTLAKTIEYAKSKGMFVIVDGKRNDIGPTASAYAAAYLGETAVGGGKLSAFGADALTVNGYLGTDGLTPFTDICKANDKGIFILVKTSNKSSGELQDKNLDDKTVYEFMGQICENLGADTVDEYGYSAVGAVVGATYPEQLTELRKKLPHTFFLVPGYGAQGGGAAGLRGAFDENGLGAVVNSSRAIMCAYKTENAPGEAFAEAARREALRMRDDINANI